MAGAPPENAEKASNRRSRVLYALAVVLLMVQGIVLRAMQQQQLHGFRLVDQVQITAFALFAFALMVAVLTGGRWARRHPVLNDELVRANRASALRLGYIAVMTALLALFVGSEFKLVETADYMPIVITLGAVIPAIRFALLERRGEAVG